ncbi:ribonuclease H-like domain-containing protein [Tanacetum coccineum]
MCMFALIVSTAELKNIKEAMDDFAWIEATQDELHQFDRLQVWELVDQPFGKTAIKLKWLWKYKKDEDQTVIRNKARRVAKGYVQEEGLQIHQSPRGIFINQAKYTLEILKKHGMDKCDSIGTPLATKPKLDADLSVQAVCYWVCYQARPTEKHLKEVKRIFRYLKGTINMRLWYPKNFGLELTTFLDVDHAGCIDTRKSMYGGIQFIAFSYQAHQCPLPLYKEQVERCIIELYFVRIEYQLDDMFTKALPEERFQYLVRQIVILFSIHSDDGNLPESTSNKLCGRGSYAISWKPYQGDSSKLSLAYHREWKLLQTAAQTTTNVDGTLTTLIPGLVTTEEKVQKKNDVMARSMLLMALPNEHLMTFNQNKDAKTLFAAIQTRFGGNEATKKTQKTLLKQTNTNEVNTVYGVSTANTQVSPASTQVSTTSTQVSTANLSDDTVYAFLASQPNGSQLVYEDLEQIHEDDIEEMDLKWQLALLSMRTRRFFQKTGRKITINGSDTAGYDKSKSYMADDKVPTNMALMAFSDYEVHNDKTCSKICLKSFETLKTQLDDLRIEFNKSEFNLPTYKRGLASVEKQLVFYRKNEVIFCEQLVVLKRDISYKNLELSMLKSELEKLKQEKESNQLKIENFNNAFKSLDKLIGSQIPDKSRKGLGFVSYNVVPPPPTRLFSPPNLDFSNSGLEEFQQPEFEGYGPKTSKNVSEDTSNEVRESPDALMVEKLVSDDKLENKTVFPTVAKIEFVRPKQ